MRNLASLVLLSAILASAVYSDLRSHRISNKLIVLGLIVGLGLQGLGGGLQGLGSALLGAGVGLACFAPFYLLRAMGAGDVKLLAAVGAFVGPQGALYAALFSLLAGGAGAIGYVLWRVARASVGTFVREGPATVTTSAFIAAQLARRERLPFALPIAVGGVVTWWYQMKSGGVATWLP
jgi:prepilin peptidase CpaA